MPWTGDPFTAIPGQMMTAALWNAEVRDRLLLLKTSVANDGRLDSTSGVLRRPILFNFIEGWQNANAVAGVLTLDLTYGEHVVVLNQNITSFVFANSPWSAGAVTTCTLRLEGDGVARTINWVTGGNPIRFSGSAAPAPSSAIGYFDIVTMRTYDNVNWFAAVFGQRM